MRKLLLLLALVVGCAAFAQAIEINTGKRFEFTDCAAGGSSSQSLTEGVYVMRITTEDVFLCYASTCATTGEKWPAGTVILISIPRGGKTVSCRSNGATGDAIFTSAS